MTCIEKYKQKHGGQTPNIKMWCPNISGEIRIDDPEYCTGDTGQAECEQCWNREVPEPPSQEDYFREITARMTEVYIAKNHDYGNSFAKLRERYPTSILVRLADKLNRLETLMLGADAKVKEESIDDTLLDMANYAVMELVERKMEKHDNK